MADKSAADAAIVANLGFAPTPVVVEGEWTVDKALAQLPADQSPPSDPTTPLPFFHILERLKTTKREGWRRFGVMRGESIADHMYRMSLISMLCPPALAARVDLNKCVRMCLVHDMAELLVGDITPVDGVSKPEKSRREAQTMDFLTGGLLRGVPGGSDAGGALREAWQEYEDGKTLESRFVHDVDKVELLLQMIEYERRAGHRVDLSEFTYVAGVMELEETRAWGQAVLAERDEFWKGRPHAALEERPAELKKQQDEYYDQS